MAPLWAPPSQGAALDPAGPPRPCTPQGASPLDPFCVRGGGGAFGSAVCAWGGYSAPSWRGLWGGMRVEYFVDHFVYDFDRNLFGCGE